MENILIISPQLPSNPNGGAKVMFDRFKLLSQHYNLYMLVKAGSTDVPPSLDFFKKIRIVKKTRPVQFFRFLYRYFIKTIFSMYVDILFNKVRIIQIEFYDGLVYALFLFPAKIIGAKVFYTAHDIQALYYPKESFKYHLIKNIEIFFFKYLVTKIFVWGSDDERQLISWGINKNKVQIIPPIIESSNEKWQLVKSPSLIFIGSIKHKPNRDSLDYIFKNVWPKVKVQHPRAVFNLVLGSDEVLDYGLDVVNHGYVEDLKTIMKDSMILVAPIVTGTGIKIKIIESFDYGLPVISTKLGFRNFTDLDENSVLVAEDSESFVKIINELILNPERLAVISDYQKKYSSNYFSKNNINKYFNAYSNNEIFS